MKNAITTVMLIREHKLILRETVRGWAIVVPGKLLIDNYYHGVHIHPDRMQLPIDDPQLIFDIVQEHLKREKTINQEKLKKELGL